ncbi:hypothetical protein CASFOL_022282 [Castilleja foliolosa]|uniref:K Homology domain-containing protein n=1 Tax=Castilleja foliolosa TaxID=1961234 RepID=A0ABD3CXY3_9LAMI
MAEEVKYSSVGGESNKRKYGGSPPPPAPVPRRASGFSSTPDLAAPPSSYNSVPPPMSDIESAKQKAQEIAARLLSNADPLKRARVENGEGGGGGGYDSSDYSTPKPMGMGFSGQSQIASSGYPGPSKKIEIPSGRVGVIIGKGGDTIKYLQLQSGAKIQVTRDMDADPNSTTRAVELMGTAEQIAKAEQLINETLSEAEAGGTGGSSRRFTGQTYGSEQFVMKVANNKVGLVIGKGGETIKSMQANTGARIQVIPLHLPPGDMSKERTVQIDGTSEQIEAARQLVEEVTSEGRGRASAGNRPRNSSMTGGYPQQGYQARPQNNWAPSMQQPNYGYAQPGPYTSQPAQYNMNQPSYPGYSSQPASGAYAAAWDQSSTAPQNPQTGGYDYYNQQQQQPSQQQSSNPPSDGSGYNYNQAPAYTQAQVYGQDGYYSAQSGYDQQQQQGYNTNYGNVSNPTHDGSTNQGEANQVPPPGSQSQPTANQKYPPQSEYAGYGLSQPQKPPPGGQPGYAQSADMGSQRATASYQVPSKTGYGAQPYGAPPAAQTGYGQQYQAPGYNGSYGGDGYSQPPPAYSSEAIPATHSGQASGPAKASPTS